MGMRLSKELEQSCMALAVSSTSQADAKPFPDRISEKEFQAEVIRFAKNRGWLVYHTYISKRSAAGFPDLAMVRGDRHIFAELKTEEGKLTADQTTWIESMLAAGLTTYIWRPCDWPAITGALE